jgi:hypothetical protein
MAGNGPASPLASSSREVSGVALAYVIGSRAAFWLIERIFAV